MKNLDLDNIDNLDESFSNFRAFGIGKPSQKQIDKWEVKNPKKYDRLVRKGKIKGTEKDDEPTVKPEIIQDNSKTSNEEKPNNTAIIVSGVVGGILIVGVALFFIFKKKG